MLMTSLAPLLANYSLALDLIAGPDGTITLTVIPRKSEGSKTTPIAAELRPIQLTASAADIDAELAKGTDGALGGLVASRKTLAEQLAEQHASAERARAAAADAAKAKVTTTPAKHAATATIVPPPSLLPEGADAKDPATLF